jgi:HSP90 family molecular chaperone
MDAKDVTPEMHDEFYRFVGTSYDRPRFTLHYKTDAPLTLRALLYFPEGKPGKQHDMYFTHTHTHTQFRIMVRRFTI